jgi:hypothetical protein
MSNGVTESKNCVQKYLQETVCACLMTIYQLTCRCKGRTEQSSELLLKSFQGPGHDIKRFGLDLLSWERI